MIDGRAVDALITGMVVAAVIFGFIAGVLVFWGLPHVWDFVKPLIHAATV